MSWRIEAAERAGALRVLREVQEKAPADRDFQEWLSHRIAEVVTSLRAPDSGPETSAQAARNMSMSKDSLRHRALAQYLCAASGLTDEEVGDAMGHPRIWPRCSELRAMKLIACTGETRLVPRTGQDAEVCSITSEGLAVLAALDGEA